MIIEQRPGKSVERNQNTQTANKYENVWATEWHGKGADRGRDRLPGKAARQDRRLNAVVCGGGWKGLCNKRQSQRRGTRSVVVVARRSVGAAKIT